MTDGPLVPVGDGGSRRGGGRWLDDNFLALKAEDNGMAMQVLHRRPRAAAGGVRGLATRTGRTLVRVAALISLVAGVSAAR